ncbi:hypothetical protein DFJ74DRAFT_100033 [Hyaloraphidium curvatum]|nr:hypothetical protein DFJ74DRAFT_100033 [Hyaloraphidium curvatum]
MHRTPIDGGCSAVSGDRLLFAAGGNTTREVPQTREPRRRAMQARIGTFGTWIKASPVQETASTLGDGRRAAPALRTPSKHCPTLFGSSVLGAHPSGGLGIAVKCLEKPCRALAGWRNTPAASGSRGPRDLVPKKQLNEIEDQVGRLLLLGKLWKQGARRSNSAAPCGASQRCCGVRSGPDIERHTNKAAFDRRVQIYQAPNTRGVDPRRHHQLHGS